MLARKAPNRAWDESVGGWLHGVAYRLALKARAAARRPIPAGAPRSAPITPDAEAAHRELQTLLDGELRALPAPIAGRSCFVISKAKRAMRPPANSA